MSIEMPDIVKRWLSDDGYDGLCDSDNECGCDLDNFMHCGEPSTYCVAAHRTKPPVGSDYDYYLVPGKRPEK